jgi:hypothetical protein
MSKKALRALRARLNGERPRLNPNKHPILSGAVPLVDYVAPRWRYGNARS